MQKRSDRPLGVHLDFVTGRPQSHRGLRVIKTSPTEAANVYVCVCVICVIRAIVQCEEKLTISASWSKDEDISRLLQSLPNWANMAQPRQTRQKREDEEDFTRYAWFKHTEPMPTSS